MKQVSVCLENIRSLYNVGAILRTCSFFGVQNVILLGYSGKNKGLDGKTMLHSKVKKTSLGSENDVNLIFLSTQQELVEFAKNTNSKIISFEQSQKATSLLDWKPKDNLILVFGNEKEGVSKQLIDASDEIVEISGIGIHNSLNVTTACGIGIQKAISREVIPN